VPSINREVSHTKYHYTSHISSNSSLKYVQKSNSQNGDTEVKNGGVNIYIYMSICNTTFRIWKPYGVRRHRRQKQGLVSQSGLHSNHTSCRFYTSRENYSLRLPCQFGNLGGTRKELSEDAESAKTAEDKVACLRLNTGSQYLL
jgi:hypothetical protein